MARQAKHLAAASELDDRWGDMIMQRVGLIGAGNMAGALIRGLLSSGAIDRERLSCSDVRHERLEEIEREHGIGTTRDNRQLTRWANVVVLAVKPQVVERVLSEVAEGIDQETLLVSIAAGVPISALADRLPPGSRIVRAMPNTAAMALAGATAIARGNHATEQDLVASIALFEAIGRAVVIDESLMNAVTGLSGSGPAYVMLMIEALADGAVKMGLPRDIALLLSAQTLYGSAKLQLETREHPGRLKDLVTSPGGTTIAGLHALEAGRLRATLMDAVEAATRRSAELGKAMAEKRG
jgi:pyrroline-5-carboxylate reductase